MNDPFPCVELDCGYLSVRTLTECEKARCPWAYTRLREENRIKDDALLAEERKGKEGDKCL
jgi:hypothetical protein